MACFGFSGEAYRLHEISIFMILSKHNISLKLDYMQIYRDDRSLYPFYRHFMLDLYAAYRHHKQYKRN